MAEVQGGRVGTSKLQHGVRRPDDYDLSDTKTKGTRHRWWTQGRGMATLRSVLLASRSNNLITSHTVWRDNKKKVRWEKME